MTSNILIQCGFYLVALLALAKPLGEFFARVLAGEPTFLRPVLGWLERLTYRASGVDEKHEMRWTEYAVAALLFNLAGLLAVYALQRLQDLLPLNPAGLGAVSPDSSWNTAVSFATNTNWQGYGGESTMSYLTQMLVLAVQNFVSAATGIAVLAALARAFSRKQSATIGNFWADLTRSTLYILLPLSLVLALALVSQGVVQTFKPYVTAQTVEKIEYEERRTARRQADDGQGRQAGDGEEDHAGADPAARARRLAGRHQAARHQRRRLLQRQFRASLREPDAALELPRDAVDPGHRRRAVHHLRPDGGRRAPGLGGARRHDDPARRPCSRSRSSPSNRATRFSSRPGRVRRRQHGRQGGALRHRQLRDLGDRDHRRLERLGQLDARLLHAARRPGADVADAARRGGLRRRRLRALRHDHDARWWRCSSPA